MEDTFPDETILLIVKRYPHTDDHVYTYVVSKLVGRWFITGQGETGKGRSWDELLAWLGRGDIVSAKVAATFERVVVL